MLKLLGFRCPKVDFINLFMDMKKLVLILFFLFSSFFTVAKSGEPCTVKYYVQVGHNIVNLVVDCDTLFALNFSIYNAEGDQLTQFSYHVEPEEKMIQLNLSAFPEGIYFITVNDGYKTTRFILNYSSKNP